MIAYLNGIIADMEDDTLVIDVGGIGYHVRVPLNIIAFSPGIGDRIKIYTYTLVREDAFQLFGFLSKDDLSIFKKLILVNGIGPKGALSILSSMSADTLRFAIFSGDAKTIAKAPGIGARTAERLILDLKDKISFPTVIQDGEAGSSGKMPGLAQGFQDVIEALVALGYSSTEAHQAIKKSGVSPEENTEVILKKALLML